MRIRALSVLSVLALAPPGAWAQQQPSPSSPPPPLPAVATTPVPLLPPSSSPPPAVAPAGEQGIATAPAPLAVVAPIRAASALPPDSMRPADVPDVIAPPAGVVALCADGTYVVAPAEPSECAVNGGLRVVFPHGVAPAPRSAAVNPARPLLSLEAIPDTPPLGASMRCRDGTYLTGTPRSDRCSTSGGVAVVFPELTQPTPLPPRP